jgi:hypothetical protein
MNMAMKLLSVAGLILAISAPLAHAQEDWGERRRERMHGLRIACEDGDERACWRLRRMRHEWREDHEQREQERGWDDRPHPPRPYQNDRY